MDRRKQNGCMDAYKIKFFSVLDTSNHKKILASRLYGLLSKDINANKSRDGRIINEASDAKDK